MLFKILKGDSSRISKENTPFNEGYAYFTPDDTGFYIDALVGEDEERIRINERSRTISAVLTADGWSGQIQAVPVQGLSEAANGVIGLANDITPLQRDKAISAGLQVVSQVTGAIVISAADEAPDCDIPIIISIYD